MATTWTLRPSDDPILRVWIDRPDRSVNALSRQTLEELDDLLGRIESLCRQARKRPSGDRGIRGVLFLSGKPEQFIVGADIDEIAGMTSPDDARLLSQRGQQVFDRLANLPVPTAALISGNCLGGGLEFAMACRYRIAHDHPKTLLGLPEVQLGLIPAWGGTVRLPGLVGLVRAVHMITAGERVNARQALSLGLVDAVAAEDEIEETGKQWIENCPPRRRSRVRLLFENSLAARLILLGAKRRVLRKSGGHYPAPLEAIEAIRAGTLGSPAAGQSAEQAAVARLAAHPVTAECLRLYFLRERSKKWARAALPDLPDAELPSAEGVRVVGVVGAGTMGAGIARLLADRGLSVLLHDVSAGQLERAMHAIRRLYESDIRGQRIRPEFAAESVSRIRPATASEGFDRADLVIEAVVEELAIKQRVFGELERVCRPDAVLATNTSSLCLRDIAGQLSRPERILAIHFFNPPHRMPLVELARTRETSPRSLSLALGIVRLLGKTAIVVGDGAGFLVNRLLMRMLNEAGYLLDEVDDPLEIEEAAREFGLAMGPLELADLVGLPVAQRIAQNLHAAHGERMRPAPAWERLASHAAAAGTPSFRLLQLHRLRYDLQPPLAAAGTPSFRLLQRPRFARPRLTVESLHVLTRRERSPIQNLSPEEIADRLVLPMVDESARCLAEGIASHPDQVDLAMVLGTGFAPFRGGLLRYAASIGLGTVLEKLDRRSASVPRLAPSEALRQLAAGTLRFASP